MNIVRDKGIVTVDNTKQIKLDGNDIEIDISKDGKIWININGISFMRFRSTNKKVLK